MAPSRRRCLLEFVCRGTRSMALETARNDLSDQPASLKSICLALEQLMDSILI